MSLTLIENGHFVLKGDLTLVVPHPETVATMPAGGSNSQVGGGKLMGLADETLKSKGVANFYMIQ